MRKKMKDEKAVAGQPWQLSSLVRWLRGGRRSQSIHKPRFRRLRRSMKEVLGRSVRVSIATELAPQI
jgi:hypothetical protein